MKYGGGIGSVDMKGEDCAHARQQECKSSMEEYESTAQLEKAGYESSDYSVFSGSTCV